MVVTAMSAFAEWLNTTFATFDYSIFEFFGNVIHADWLTPIVNIYTHFGDSEFIIPLAVLGVVLCCFKKTRKVGMTLVLAIVIGTMFTNICIKPFVGRPRPFQSLADDANYMKWYTEAGSNLESLNKSFPSGHTTGAFEVATALFLTVHNKKIKWIFPVYAVLIACSRIYLMVHYPTDVIAGFIIGTVAGIIAYFVAKALLKLINKSKFADFDLADIIKKKKQV